MRWVMKMIGSRRIKMTLTNKEIDKIVKEGKKRSDDNKKRFSKAVKVIRRELGG